MKKVLTIGILALLSNPILLFAQSHSRKYEAFAIGGAMLAILLFVGGWYYYLTNKKKTKSGDKYIVKTVEAYKNGRKIIMTKKYRVVQDQEFPNELKRSTRR